MHLRFTCWGVWSTGEFSVNSSPILKQILFVFRETFTEMLTHSCNLFRNDTDLKCQVPFFSLFDNLNGWACVCQHLPVYFLKEILLVFFSPLQNLPDHPGHAHGCEVLLQTLTFLMLKNPNSFLHLDY